LTLAHGSLIFEFFDIGNLISEQKSISIFRSQLKCDDEKSVWFYFTRDASGNLAKCAKCDRENKTVGGSTKGLHVPLQAKHNIDLLKRTSAKEPTVAEVVQPMKKTRIKNAYVTPKTPKGRLKK